MGGVRASGLLVGGIALFCLGISLSFLAGALATNAAAATTTEVCCAPGGKALGDAHGEALVRPDEDPISGPLTTPGDEAREGEELSVRASLLMSMLVVATSSFNSSLKGVAHHPLGVLLGGSLAAGRGRASLLGVFLL
jgi:hypothetical protein